MERKPIAISLGLHRRFHNHCTSRLFVFCFLLQMACSLFFISYFLFILFFFCLSILSLFFEFFFQKPFVWCLLVVSVVLYIMLVIFNEISFKGLHCEDFNIALTTYSVIMFGQRGVALAMTCGRL